MIYKETFEEAVAIYLPLELACMTCIGCWWAFLMSCIRCSK